MVYDWANAEAARVVTAARRDTFKMRSSLKRSLRTYGIACGLSALALGAAFAMLWQTAQAQGDGWTQPQLIFEGRGVISAPTLIADVFGRVHAFWIFLADNQGDHPQE